MAVRHLIKKQLALTPCRFILGCIGPTEQLSNGVNPELLSAIENERTLGGIEDVLPVQEFPEAPESYLDEIGSPQLATTIIILERAGGYMELHHLKRGTLRVEKQFSDSNCKRIFNINPGAVGTYGICLASHKPNEFRGDSTTYAYGLHPHLFTFPAWLFGGETFYERIARWGDNRLVLLDRITEENRFPEYAESGRLARFEDLVRTLPRSSTSVELSARAS